MTDTASAEVTSDGKLCAACAGPFGEDDDRRFAQCAACRQGDAKPAQPSTTVAASDFEPIKIDVDKLSPPPVEARDFYWCGATHDCPMDITLGGIEFPKTIGRLKKQHDGNARLETDYREGVIHRLTEKHVALVLEHAANRVVRNFREEETPLLSGEKVTKFLGTLKSISGNKRRVYRAEQGDKPLGQFVYMVRVKHADDRPLQDPPTMVPRDW